MRPHQRKAVYFVIEGLNAFACTYYFNYTFFLLRDQFGFGNRENLLVSALHGLVYVFAAIYGGRFAQRNGYHTAMNLGLAGMIGSLALGFAADPLGAKLVALVLWTISMCFTWPALEAVISHGENDRSLPRMLGIYNVTWAGGAALAYFSGGALKGLLGTPSLYWLPMALYAAQIFMLRWLEKEHQPGEVSKTSSPLTPALSPDGGEGARHHEPEAAAFQQPVKPEAFLKMAWLANPFAYIAINTVLAVIPELALRFNLSTAQTGMFCSVWFFTRLATFFLLWYWTGWHYRFRWLVAAFVGLIGGFATLLLAGQLWLLVAAQIVFGLCTGLIYYSSLFYSMDVGEDTQGEHGGVHEAAIGLGIFLGPGIGAAGLYFAPASPDASTWAVSGLLLCGLGGLLWLRWRPANHAVK